ncbi:isocitrate lyase/phosphoenolpyruvate mutase family protein [Chitinophaga sp. G-6-1-13]|uniref:Isocitrate lyase/phosphoenolpyruvate mutase family protein n=1 Tax=Chitinophaga fulva TaxID=2728842 RepID=A0A848GQ42_9BACT|nr:isocitrate lyase/phosphoenolpyruvate mutase family protein [Chitinophaga fulva]NML39671.1 isocitrate lyase/phosphoenolpyruvate mutase family protein [Chitinophaga fulva]
MSSMFNAFKELHQERLLVLPNVWNPESARRFQEKGFPAVATSSAAVAASLGYEDGEGMPFDDYLFIVRRMTAILRIPLSVDIEMGYGHSPEAIYANISRLLEAGVVGINLEDSTIGSTGRVLQPAATFAATLESVRNRLTAAGADLFLNARTDTYLLNVANKEAETEQRLRLYETSGADGIFLPCITEEAAITTAVSQTKLPLNVMCMPGLPALDVLEKLGVKRVSMGPFLYNKVYDHIGQLSEAITTAGSFDPVFI